MLLFNSPVKNSIIIYLIIAIYILVIKPSYLFNEYGDLIEFGTKDDQSLFNYPVILYMSSIIITFFFEYISIKKY
jgi:hypothetical protein